MLMTVFTFFPNYEITKKTGTKWIEEIKLIW